MRHHRYLGGVRILKRIDLRALTDTLCDRVNCVSRFS